MALKVGWCQYATVQAWWLCLRSSASHRVSWVSRPPSVVEQSLWKAGELHSTLSEMTCQVKEASKSLSLP